MSLDIAHCSFNFSDESLDVSDASEWKVESFKDTLEEAIHKLFNISLLDLTKLVSVSNGGQFNTVSDVLSHGEVFATVVGGDGASDVVVDIDSVNDDILSNLEGDVPC